MGRRAITDPILARFASAIISCGGAWPPSSALPASLPIFMNEGIVTLNATAAATTARTMPTETSIPDVDEK